jgi:hypothetical protein
MAFKGAAQTSNGFVIALAARGGVTLEMPPADVNPSVPFAKIGQCIAHPDGGVRLTCSTCEKTRIPENAQPADLCRLCQCGWEICLCQ